MIDTLGQKLFSSQEVSAAEVHRMIFTSGRSSFSRAATVRPSVPDRIITSIMTMSTGWRRQKSSASSASESDPASA